MTAPLDLDALKAKALAATRGPWEVQTDKHPHFRGGAHTEHRIRTAWIQGQLKDHWPVVTTSVGIPEFENGRPCRMVAISKEDAEHIAAACPATMLELLARLERAEESAAQSAHDTEALGRAIDRAGAAGGVRAPGMTFSVSNMIQLAQKMGAELRAGWMAAAARSDTPEPVYDPSLNVPAEIVEAANTVSTWAAKQDRGSWRIGNVCSPDFGGNQQELARLRSNVAILSAQSEALHLVGHAIGVPAGDDVTKAVLPAVKALTERAARAETIANSVLESITSQPNTVMVMNAGQAENVVGLAHELARIIPAKSTVIVLQDGATLEQLNQDDMRRHGWVRAEEGAQ